jgi:hypothetical protein
VVPTQYTLLDGRDRVCPLGTRRHIVADHIETGGGQTPDDLGSSSGVVNPGAEDLSIDDDDSDEN